MEVTKTEIIQAHINTIDEILCDLGGDTIGVNDQMAKWYNKFERESHLTKVEQRALVALLWRGHLELLLKQPA